MRKNRLAEIPDVMRLEKLTKLNLNSNAIKGTLAPAGLPPSLEHLNVSGNQLTSVDGALASTLPRLSSLDLHANHLTPAGIEALSAALCGWRKLEKLDLSSNRLTALPTELLEAAHVVELKLSLNPLGVCPDLRRMRGLLHLAVARCGLACLPDDLLTSLPKLATLDVARNGISVLPPPAKGADLTRLYAAHNCLGHVGADLMGLGLVELDLSHNVLTAWPDGLGSGGILERIILSFNRIRELPAAASKVASSAMLRELLIDHNDICEVASSKVTVECHAFSLAHNPIGSAGSGAFRKLAAQTVHLSSCALTCLPTISARCEALHAVDNRLGPTIEWASLSACTKSLTILNLSHNDLVSLPEQIGQCPRLLELLVGYNRLTSLPPSCAKLTSLVVLVLSGNALTSVPEQVFSMPSLQWLWLSNNEIRTLPSLEGLTKLQSLLVNDNALTEIDTSLMCARARHASALVLARMHGCCTRR